MLGFVPRVRNGSTAVKSAWERALDIYKSFGGFDVVAEIFGFLRDEVPSQVMVIHR